MQLISRLEHESRLDGLVSAGQRVARLIPPGPVRDALHGVWLGHPLHPMLVQASIGAWLSASILDFTGGGEKGARHLVTAGLAAAFRRPRRARPTGQNSTSSRCASGSCTPRATWPH